MPQSIYIMDTTLRDGEQAPGVNLNYDEKLQIARQLDSLGVDIIEAGFAAASPGDFRSVERVARHMKRAAVATLCRCATGDIETGAKALAKAREPLLHLFIATSPIHMEYKLRMTPEQVLERAVASVKFARNLCPQVEFSCEDGSRTERAFLYRMLESVIDAGATVVNIPDTVGYAMPEEYAHMVRGIFVNVPNIDKARVSVHCHDDLGLAVSNSLCALAAGARQVEGTMLGIGERAGNAALEEVVMALHTRRDFFDFTTNVHTTAIYRATSTVSSLTGLMIPPNKAIVGQNAFRHESGIHQHGVLANPATYEIMTPASIGIPASAMVLGKHSGRHAFVEKLTQMGYVELTDAAIDEAFARFKALADAKKEVFERDIEALVGQRLTELPSAYALDSFLVQSGNKIHATASVSLRFEGKEILESAVGNGSVDAVFGAIGKAIGRQVVLESYGLRAVTEGTDALGEVTTRVTVDGISATGRGLSIDIIEASAMAYLSAINRALYDLAIRAGRPEPEEETC